MGGPSGDIVNSAGSSLSRDDYSRLYGVNAVGGIAPGQDSTGRAPSTVVAAHMFLNWLTAGSAPKTTDPGQIFTDQQATGPAAQDAARGQGFGGLFGTGSIIGEIAPPVQPIKPLQGLKPLNTSPLQPGVPYSVPAVPKVGGR